MEMSLSLSDLLLCCRELESDRATDRKVGNHVPNAWNQAQTTTAAAVTFVFFGLSAPPEGSRALQKAPLFSRGCAGAGPHLRIQNEGFQTAHMGRGFQVVGHLLSKFTVFCF